MLKCHTVNGITWDNTTTSSVLFESVNSMVWGGGNFNGKWEGGKSEKGWDKAYICHLVEFEIFFLFSLCPEYFLIRDKITTAWTEKIMKYTVLL